MEFLGLHWRASQVLDSVDRLLVVFFWDGSSFVGCFLLGFSHIVNWCSQFELSKFKFSKSDAQI